MAVTAVGTEVGNTQHPFNDVAFSVSDDGELVATYQFNGAISDTAKSSLSNVLFDDDGDGNFMFVGSNSALQTSGANAISRVETIVSPGPWCGRFQCW